LDVVSDKIGRGGDVCSLGRPPGSRQAAIGQERAFRFAPMAALHESPARSEKQTFALVPTDLRFRPPITGMDIGSLHTNEYHLFRGPRR
jgi:hypothetical protein